MAGRIRRSRAVVSEKENFFLPKIFPSVLEGFFGGFFWRVFPRWWGTSELGTCTYLTRAHDGGEHLAYVHALI